MIFFSASVGYFSSLAVNNMINSNCRDWMWFMVIYSDLYWKKYLTLFLGEVHASTLVKDCFIYQLREKCPNTELLLFCIFLNSDWINSNKTANERTIYFSHSKGALSSLEQFLTTEYPRWKIDVKCFFSTDKLFSSSRYFNFCLDFWDI